MGLIFSHSSFQLPVDFLERWEGGTVRNVMGSKDKKKDIVCTIADMKIHDT